ncbi:MAG TPA: DUF4920 domain-containing protein [Polyangiaceae bacterium]|jgi:hypothetical protein|nr:DUF4920 domain-containing protein [Polyangiaceae bacterium]
MTRFGSPSARSWLFTALLVSSGCHARAEQTEPASSAPAPAASAEVAIRAVKRFGAPIAAAPELVLADVLRAPERYNNQAITVEGHVRSACTRRGCWMEVATDADPALPGCRVTFKDYGFFVPTDSAGASAKVQGTLDVNTLPPERVAHLESEGGHFPQKNPDGSVNELRLVATGVELWR